MSRGATVCTQRTAAILLEVWGRCHHHIACHKRCIYRHLSQAAVPKIQTMATALRKIIWCILYTKLIGRPIVITIIVVVVVVIIIIVSFTAVNIKYSRDTPSMP